MQHVRTRELVKETKGKFVKNMQVDVTNWRKLGWVVTLVSVPLLAGVAVYGSGRVASFYDFLGLTITSYGGVALLASRAELPRKYRVRFGVTLFALSLFSIGFGLMLKADAQSPPMRHMSNWFTLTGLAMIMLLAVIVLRKLRASHSAVDER